ncbi:MAG TPA: HAD family phosphatase [Candidatus Binatia bacterium]
MRIDAVLFDFGGVFMDSPFEAVRNFGERCGVGADRILELVFGRYDDDTDHPWHRLERGEITLEAARQAILELAAPHRVDLFEALGSMARAAVRDEMVEIARFARASGRRTAVVTNNVREFGHAWRAMLPVDELFDAVVDSHEIGMRKPNPRVFAYALERLGNVPCANAVFLDDFEGNVEAARRAGLHGIVVGPDWRRAVSELRALLEAESRR